LNILVFSQHFWPESFRINDVAQSLRAAGHTVTVLTGQPNYPNGAVYPGYSAASTGVEPWNGIDIYRVPLTPRGANSARRLVMNYVSFMFSAAVFGACLLRRQRFDVVFVYASSPLLQAISAIALARLKSCAIVTWVQDLWPQSLEATGYIRNPRVLAMVAAVVRGIYKRQDLVLVQSHGFLEPVRKLAPAGLKVCVHPNPSDDQPDDHGPAALQLAPGFNVVFAGNLGKAQALDAVLDAADLLGDLPDVRFVLVGSGQRSDELAGLVRARGLGNVQLPGRFAPQQMPAILAQADALLVSLVDDPAMALTVPSKVQSYLAAGKPVIAALNGEGARVVAEAGAGLACAAADGQALAQAVRRLYALPETERIAMGEAGRQHHDKHYAPAVLTPRLIAHLQDAIDLHRQSRSAGRRQY
jgi:glycosyltransferase involved in cell wall biosynthesis